MFGFSFRYYRFFTCDKLIIGHITDEADLTGIPYSKAYKINPSVRIILKCSEALVKLRAKS